MYISNCSLVYKNNKKGKKSKTTKCPFIPTIPSALKIVWLERVEGRDIHKTGLVTSSNFLLANFPAQSPSLLTESLKTRLISCILSPCCHFWNMNDLSCSHKGHLWKSLFCYIYEALKTRQMFLKMSTTQKHQPPPPTLFWAFLLHKEIGIWWIRSWFFQIVKTRMASLCQWSVFHGFQRAKLTSIVHL